MFRSVAQSGPRKGRSELIGLFGGQVGQDWLELSIAGRDLGEILADGTLLSGWVQRVTALNVVHTAKSGKVYHVRRIPPQLLLRFGASSYTPSFC